MSAKVIPLHNSRRYVIERELGRGGMGVVYEALDLERGTRVALKALHHTDAINIYRLKKEFRQLADLSHPNLVTLHELCFDGDKWFFTMELVDGQTLDEYVTGTSIVTLPPPTSPTPSGSPLRSMPPATLAGRGRLVRHPSVTLNQHAIGSEFPLPRITANIPRLRSTLRQLVEAIAALHDADRLHRDIKPSNVLVTQAGRVVVLDFGLVSDSTQVEADQGDPERSVGGSVFGTPAYMSPEQAAGEPVTTASDWYSVGAVLYEALTGQLPFDGTVLQILKQKDELEPIPPAELMAGVPDDLDQLCRALLRRDPTKRPTRQEILRELLGGSQPLPAPLEGSSSMSGVRRAAELFIGREPHLAKLREGFEKTKRGEAATILVRGHSGMGKSALVRCFANELIRNDEAVVLRGRCYERESVPYKAFDDVIDALSRYMMRRPVDECTELLPRNIHALARLFPVLTRVKAVAQARLPRHQSDDPREIRDQAFGALRDLLLRLSDYRPLVINIDDLQWGDIDSARMLTHLLGGPAAPPILFVGSYRIEEASSSAFLRHMRGEHPDDCASFALENLEVDALSSDEAEQLTRELLRDTPEVSALLTHAIAAEAGGVPFFIGELTQHVKALGAQAPAALASITLDNVISARVANMPPDAQRVLEVLSVAARPIEQGVVVQAAGLVPGDRGALLALRAARLIRTRGTRQSDCAETYHDRVREAVVAQLSDERLREVHAAIANASVHWGAGEPEHLVVHYAEAGEGGRAGETAIQAARAAADKLAFNRAADLYRKAIELIGTSDPRRVAEQYQGLGDALANAGRGLQAAEAYLEAARIGDAADAAARKRKAAQQLLRAGSVDEGMALLRDLLAEVDSSLPEHPAAAFAALAWNKTIVRFGALQRMDRKKRTSALRTRELLETLGASFRELSTIDPLRGALLHAQYLRAALRSGDTDHMLHGLAWEAMHASFAGGPGAEQRVERLLQRASKLADEAGVPYAQATVLLARAGCALSFARFAEALGPAADAEALFRERCRGASWERGLATAYRYAGLELAGDLNEMASEAHARAREAQERDDGFSQAYLVLSVAMAHLMWNDPKGALRITEEQGRRLGTGATMFHLWVLDRTADAHLYQGHGRQAFEYFETQWQHFSGTLLARAPLLSTNARFLRARCAIGASAETKDRAFLDHADHEARALARIGRPDADAYAALIEAASAHLRGADQSAIDALHRAQTITRAHGYSNFHLYAQRNLGTLLGGEHGRKLVQRTDAALSSSGIVSPVAWVSAYAPGFTDAK